MLCKFRQEDRQGRESPICGKKMKLIGHTTQKNMGVWKCPECDVGKYKIDIPQIGEED